MELTKENTEKEITSFKEKNTKNVKDTLVEYSGLPPIMSMLVYDFDISDYGVAVINIPMEILENKANKDVFAIMAPLVMKKLAEERKQTVCVSWSTEAWIRKSTNKEDLKNWKDLPKTEALVTYYETEEESCIITHTMTRDGMRVNEDGEMVDDITLEYDESSSSENKSVKLEGRFTGIFKKFNSMKDEL